MASTFFTSFDVPNSLDLKVKHHHPFNSRTRLKKFPFFYCNSSKSPPKSQVPDLSEEPKKQNPSLADQLQTLSTTILSDTPQKPTQLLTKPKSIWVNPTKPRPSVLNLQDNKELLTHITHKLGTLGCLPRSLMSVRIIKMLS
ncbi:hypothetical protein HanIR_Chr15g0754701 [Helianthus annuus]|nr:hypothetical protein HanIR_Chr15g0754701 [Helianthus annuus]